MRLILMRHGETEWNAEQRLQGQDNSLLSERGVAQVKRFRPYAKALKPARIIASDLGRTRQTVALIGHPDAPSDERFRELGHGRVDGPAQAGPDRRPSRGLRRLARRAPSPDAGARDVGRLPRPRRAMVCTTGCPARRATCWSSPMAASSAPSAMNSLDLPPSRVVPVTPGTATILNFPQKNGAAAQLEGYNIGSVAPDVSVAD
jgi:hypothetical protein